MTLLTNEQVEIAFTWSSRGKGEEMGHCTRCGLPRIAESTYGTYVSLLYDLYMTVKNSKETINEDDRFLFDVEIDFLLQALADVDGLE